MVQALLTRFGPLLQSRFFIFKICNCPCLAKTLLDQFWKLQGVFYSPPLNKQSPRPFIKKINFKDWVYTQKIMNWTPSPLPSCDCLFIIFCLILLGIQSDLFQYFLGGPVKNTL